MRAVYFDPVGGASGDMLLAALLDLGAPVEAVRAALDTLPLPGDSHRLNADPIEVGGFKATRVKVSVSGDHAHRSLEDLLGILTGSGLTPAVRDRAERVFRRLAAAEARVHAVPVEAVHFHEVGAVDAIVDVVGSAVALELLGVEAIRFGILAPGTGVIDSAHGPLPLPAPATLELLTGVPIRLGGPVGEWVTPTAAAIFTALGRPGRTSASIRVERVGIGAGHRQRADRPNVLRALLGTLVEEGEGDPGPGEPVVEGEGVVVLEAAIDDQAPVALTHAVERLRAGGAIDVFLTAVSMKKGRSGTLVTALARPAEAEDLARCLLRETSTLGLRLRREERRVLRRQIRQVDTPYGVVRMKETRRPPAPPVDGARPSTEAEGLIDVTPETDDVIRAAAAHGVPFSMVAAAAREAWAAAGDQPPVRDEDPS